MLKKHTISFKNAFAGVFWALKTQPNYKVHLFFSFLALIGAWFLKVSYVEFLIIVLLITAGLTIETINTAIEVTTDAIEKKWNEDIKVAKDTGAASMLFFAAGAFLIACIIFIPKLILLFSK
ncbi:MAG: diacylglycerol kinase family protein [Candidatus Roizmanbacteria bacterium]|nr:MAG: diacylglycerol kinase family protein [Candidatus Roizmanbacteria bacterium]